MKKDSRPRPKFVPTPLPLLPHDGGRVTITLTGPQGAGKTFLAEQIQTLMAQLGYRPHIQTRQEPE